MNALIIYDVSERASEVKEEMLRREYYGSWLSGGANNNSTRFFLPNSSLWKKDILLTEALKDLQSVIRYLNKQDGKPYIELQRCIIVPVTPWEGIPGIERR